MNDTTLAPSASTSTLPDRTPRRVRHTLRFRKLEVRRVERLTPHMIRVVLGGDALEGFTSLGFDDHVKVFFPDEATGALRLPTAGPDGPVWPEGGKPAMRDYTPRAYDAEAGTLTIDFALHEAGPATRWAEQAKVGQELGIGGPRGSFIVPTDFDWHLLVGDDTALPAISRRLAELPAGAKALVIVEVDGKVDELPLETGADATIVWAHRAGYAEGEEAPLLAALRKTPLPAGEFHAWVGCESAVAKAIRTHLIADCKANPKWIRASGYWRRGSAAMHDSHDD